MPLFVGLTPSDKSKDYEPLIYINTENVTMIRRRTDENSACTEVYLTNGSHLKVDESPEVIAYHIEGDSAFDLYKDEEDEEEAEVGVASPESSEAENPKKSTTRKTK